MKKMVLSLVTLMVLGTSTSFGKSNTQPRDNNNNQPRMEMQTSHNNQPEMNKGGKKDKTYRCQPVPQKPEPKPEPRHNSTVDKVTTGVVIGTVIGTVISSLVK